jgi:protein-L-isoaspartate(D-aspartate) O-methyltransferase
MPLPWQRGTQRGDESERARERMVRDQIQRRGLTDPELLRAFRIVPRHLFVEGDEAYHDRALPLTQGQTISQPYVVASMTDAARPPGGWRGARALEIGTGSGYQAAILAELGAQVVSVERHASLSAQAAEHLVAAGYGPERVHLVVGDGTRGWPEGAPYDSIVVTAAGPRAPQPLLDQLRTDGGRLVMPIGPRDHQWLTIVVRQDGETVTREREPVVFVPLLGDFGFEE